IAEQHRDKLGVAGINRPKNRRRALGSAGPGERRVGGEQRADLRGVALANSIEEHALIMTGRLRGSPLESCYFWEGMNPDFLVIGAGVAGMTKKSGFIPSQK